MGSLSSKWLVHKLLACTSRGSAQMAPDVIGMEILKQGDV